jgi:hypothetical protein
MTNIQVLYFLHFILWGQIFMRFLINNFASNSQRSLQQPTWGSLTRGTLFAADLWQLHPGPFHILHSGWMPRRVTADLRGRPAGGRGFLVWNLVGRSPILQRDTYGEPLSASHEASPRPDRVQLRLPDGVQNASSRHGYRQIRGIDTRLVSVCL